MAIWENFDKLRPKSSPNQERAWVKWQARSVFYQIERRQTLSTEPITDTLAENIAEEETNHKQELIDDMLAALSPDEQRMVQLYLEGYHGDEIGEKLGINRNAVYQRMRRVIQKMQRMALVMLALFFVSAIAVAMVPQWRHFFFGGWGAEETVIDTLSEPTQTTSSYSTPQDTVLAVKDETQDSVRKLESLEKLPPLDVGNLVGCSEGLSPMPLQNSPIVWVEGRHVIITGADGELVRVYDCGGKLVVAQQANGICIINLFSSEAAYLSTGRGGAVVMTGNPYEYTLKIGNRPAIELHL